MRIKDLIEHLETLDGDALVVLRERGPLETYRSPIVGETTFVEERKPGKFIDMVDRERDRDITAYIL